MNAHRSHMGRLIEHRPRFESKPYRLSPGRRTHIYGPLVPLDEYEPWPRWLWLFIAPFVVAAIMLWIGK